MSIHPYEDRPKQRRKLRLPQLSKSNRLMKRYYAAARVRELPAPKHGS